ncbi:MAG: tRNA pseudouridine(38-40) synthase TruA [Methylococcales bacterium]|mgnify:CR=1 FL=1|jgi:tRNA pseudouridine38-40 synthase|nr:tRNA pseudouridine(38-40) synthase TruA [Methylococcales bacterium]MBT7408104.1 tRNA pseudouridine(38-40) synthase TruA [Methylococcales bacterium]
MRWVLGIEYDGTDFSGWQSQNNRRTVQQAVEQAISQVANEDVSIFCAGRTDSGVHAEEQVIHFDTEVKRNARSWIYGSNTNLPDDINVLWAKTVSADFHARFSAVKRTYRYVILNRQIRSAINRHRETWYFKTLDAEKMHMAAQSLMGEHDFTSFRAVACQANTPIRTIHLLNVSRKGDRIIIDISANAFLHHMVRNIVGVLLAIGNGDKDSQWCQQVLDAKDRTKAGVTARGEGLFLTKVDYPSEFEIN